jgi:tRNA A-37 threonylcarbamoyl transferase component Bud32
MITQVEKYKITEEIGHGGMATVYLAYDTRLDRPVALKVMHPHLQRAKEARERFAREALSAARLKHPGILEIYDYSGEDSELSYIAAELLTGPTLRNFVEEHPDIPAEIAGCFTIAVARALKAAHAEGVIHRDVKPENVMIHKDREVKLTDFGIAQMVDAQSMTTTGQVLGSPAHMAPEQIEGRECDARSDIFSLGTVLYWLATGKQPFIGRNTHHLLKMIAEGRFIDPLQAKPSIGGRLRTIILRCLELDPEKRYQSAADLEADLTEFVKQIGIDSPTDTLAQYLSDPDGFSRRLREQTVERLIAAGERSKADLAVAFDYFSRALALDDGNPQVLAALERIGRRSQMRRIGRVVAIATCALMLVGLLGSIALRHRRFRPFFAGVPAPVAKGAGLSSADPGDSPKTAISSIHATGVGAAQRKAQNNSDNATKRPRRQITVTNTVTMPRTVKFRPFPANVAIGVDGASPRSFGPSYNEVDLAAGIHRFKFVGAHECCLDEEVSIKIPPGPGATILEHRLTFRPAGLYVVSNAPANVTVDNGDAVGRTRSVIQVAHQSDLVENHKFIVTAPGFQDYTGEVKLRAGRVESVNVVLAPSAAP